MKTLITGLSILLISFQLSYAQYDTWTPTSTVNAPMGRGYFTMVWTGSKMIVWGGWNVFGGGGNLNTGGIYDPETDTWVPTSTTNAPTGRNIHCAVWTGSKMIVWGGYGYDSLGNNNYLNTGGIYDPETDTWVPTSTVNTPPPSGWATAVWTGSQMIVWGGNVAAGGVSTGGIYDPESDRWVQISDVNAPSARTRHTAVWTGSKMIIWGGWGGTPIFPTVNTGGIYDPATDTWESTDTLSALSNRYMHTAVWSGNKMIIYGGNPKTNEIIPLANGGMYDPITNTWQSTDTITAPIGRYEHSAVWTGTNMIVWGGGSGRQTGGIFNPANNTWIQTDSLLAPPKRNAHLAVWTGSKMIVWGGWDFPFDYNTGCVYTPPLSAPLAPSNLIAVADTHSVTLTWTDNSDNEDGFIIERKDGDSLSASPFVSIDTLDANITGFIDTGLFANHTYTYRVFAYNASGSSGYSNLAETTTIIPVELTAFTANVSENNVTLNWTTGTETNNQGFQIERRKTRDEKSEEWESIGFIPGFGTTTEPRSYTFIDNNITTGTYHYRLKQIDYNGTFEYSQIVEVEVNQPLVYSLNQNYPNPFNPSTSIQYSIPERQFVTLKVYDILGNEVAALVNEYQEAGRYSIKFNASSGNGNLTSGIYFYTLKAGNYAETKKMTLLK